ncbi:MAG: STAS domain-containing protein [Lachnospiraceae bacterium]|nr:STAS domain-containing protein [Lachnospiraceae bacterium]
METVIEKDGTTLTCRIIGTLDTPASPQLEAELIPAMEGIKDLILDLTEMNYILSAGIRVLLKAGKLVMKQRGTMRVRGINDSVREIFRTTGLTRICVMEK